VTRKRRASVSAVIDACCVIDLLASGKLEAILGATGYTWHLPDAVKAEVQFVRQHDPAGPDLFVNMPVDLSMHVSSGLWLPCPLTGSQEQALFVQYAAQFRSDGEAMCLAIAQSRGWLVATDDRKAIRIAHGIGLSVISCPELVKKWADSSEPSADELLHVLVEIQTLAKFVPSSSMPESAWWMKKLGAR
jgi:hypothetical protein